MSTDAVVNRTDDPSSGQNFNVRVRASDGSRTQGMHLDPEVMGDVLSWFATAGALVENHNDIGGGPCRLFKVDVVLDSAAPLYYLHVFDALTPTGVPVLRAVIPAGGAASIDLGVYGREMTTGLTVALSTTLETYTSPGSNDAVFQVAYS